MTFLVCAISLAQLVGVPIMIVHVSNGEAMEEIRRAQQKGLKVYGELVLNI